MQEAKTIRPGRTPFGAGGIGPAGLPYAATALAIGLVTLCQYLYLPAFAGYPFQFYFPVVAVAALLFGTGVFAALLSGLAALFFFIPPHFSLAITSPDPVLALTTFGIASLVIVLVVTLLSRIANHYFRALERTEREKNQATAIMLEMHRRTAGSFHDIAATLAGQAPAADTARTALLATAQRFRAMGRIHDRLALPRDSAVMVNARNFFERLCDDLQASLAGDYPARLLPRIESCEITRRQATAAGHLLTELVDEVNRRAAADGAVDITVDFSCDDDSCILMFIENRSASNRADGGALRPKRPIVATLLDQLQGSLAVEDTASPSYVIRFPRAAASVAATAA